jgi:hypothetical protein
MLITLLGCCHDRVHYEFSVMRLQFEVCKKGFFLAEIYKKEEIQNCQLSYVTAKTAEC